MPGSQNIKFFFTFNFESCIIPVTYLQLFPVKIIDFPLSDIVTWRAYTYLSNFQASLWLNLCYWCDGIQIHVEFGAVLLFSCVAEWFLPSASISTVHRNVPRSNFPGLWAHRQVMGHNNWFHSMSRFFPPACGLYYQVQKLHSFRHYAKITYLQLSVPIYWHQL